MATTADTFIELPMTTDEATLADNAIEVLRAAWPDWEPNDGDLEVVQIEAIAPMMANAAQLASQMPAAALRAYGTILLGIPYQTGAPAFTTVLFTVQDTVGYTIPAGSQIAIDGYAFNVAADTTIAPGSTTADVFVTAAENSADYNALTGADTIAISLPAWVVALSVEAPTTGGVDPQDDADYQNDLSTELQLTSRAVITLPDFEMAALAIDGIARAYAQTNSARNVTVWLLSDTGGIVSPTLKAQLMAVYVAKRLVNVTITLADPSFNEIDVTYSLVGLAGYDPTDLVTRVNAALTTLLSDLGWGAPAFGQPGDTDWYNQTVVHATKLVAAIGNVRGVDYVTAVSINGGANMADHAMTGTVALPTPGVFTGTVSF